MLNRFTVYEVRTIIQKNFHDICSDSMGAIQSAIKKLLAADMITFSEYVEKSVNKKRYSITDKGRKEFFKWLNIPADVADSKNMELGKLLYMGMLPVEKRMNLIDEIISMLETNLSYLHGVQASANTDQKKQVIEHWKSDVEYFSHVIKQSDDIAFFQEMTLQYGIDSIKFNIEWFAKLKDMQAKS